MTRTTINDATLLLLKLGWKDEGATLADPHGDYRVIFDGDLWRLEKFDDSDNADGVAEGRWLDSDEGNTLQELESVLRTIGYGIAKRDDTVERREI